MNQGYCIWIRSNANESRLGRMEWICGICLFWSEALIIPEGCWEGWVIAPFSKTSHEFLGRITYLFQLLYHYKWHTMSNATTASSYRYVDTSIKYDWNYRPPPHTISPETDSADVTAERSLRMAKDINVKKYLVKVKKWLILISPQLIPQNKDYSLGFTSLRKIPVKYR